ncbi:MAG: hypothetical protein IJ731_01190 [Eubacterium sp.]|nr:hypothetical protein [Eubacterium sp.]
MATNTNKESETNKEPETNKEVMVEVVIPLDRSNEKNDKFYCSVNGVAMLIPMGKTVKVPAPYAYAVKNALDEFEKTRNKERG